MTNPRPAATKGLDRRVWTIALGGAVAFSALYATQSAVQLMVRDEPPDVPRVFALQLLPWLAWVALLPAVFALAARWPVYDGGMRRHWWRHLLVALLAPAVHATLVVGPIGWLRGWWADDVTLVTAYQLIALNGSVATLAQYVLVAAACHAYLAARHARDQAVRASALDAQLAEAELRALRAQLQPHFLFNTLNAVAAHVRDEPDVAEAMLERLSGLLRVVLRSSAQEVPLAQELEAAHLFLGIHEVRFGARLTVSVDVAPDVEGALVPSMLLQPLLENAIVHGVATRRGPARVVVAARGERDRLLIRVEDASAEAASLPGSGASSPGTGIGLANTRARLRQLYGDAGSLDVASGAGGTVVTVAVPLRLAPRHVPAREAVARV